METQTTFILVLVLSIACIAYGDAWEGPIRPPGEDYYYPGGYAFPDYIAPVVTKENAMEFDEAKDVLKNSDNSFEMERAALSLCVIGTDEALDALMSCLLDEERRRKLETDEIAELPDVFWRVRRIVECIGLLNGKDAERCLLMLARDGDIARNPFTFWLLLRTLGSLKHVSDEVVEFLAEHAERGVVHAKYSLANLNDVRAMRVIVNLVLEEKDCVRLSGDVLLVRGAREKEATVLALGEALATKKIDRHKLEHLIWHFFADMFIPGPAGSNAPGNAWKYTSADTQILQQVLRIANGVMEVRLSEEVLDEVRQARADIIEILESRGMETDVGALEIKAARGKHTAVYATAGILLAALAVAGALRWRRGKFAMSRRKKFVCED